MFKSVASSVCASSMAIDLDVELLARFCHHFRCSFLAPRLSEFSRLVSVVQGVLPKAWCSPKARPVGGKSSSLVKGVGCKCLGHIASGEEYDTACLQNKL